MGDGVTLSGTTDNDVRLRIYCWPKTTNLNPVIEYFAPTSWNEAIQRAYDLSLSGEERFHKFQVIDAWGMLIAQFTSRWIYKR